MSSKPYAVYEFGGYQLNSVQGSLSMSGQRIDLPEKALEALIYLADHSGKLVTTTELTKQLWSARPVHGGSIRRLITELRGILNDDWRNPRYIQTVHSKRGYRFIAQISNPPDTPVILDEKPRSFETRSSRENEGAENYQITSHIFVPVYLGPDLIRKIKSPMRVTDWLSYKEFQIENGRLCLLPNGMGVWQLNSTDKFSTLSDYAAWRKRTYEAIFGGRHKIIKIQKELTGKGAWPEKSIFAPIFGKLSYAYTLAKLDFPQFKELSRAKNTLEILSCPKPLEPNSGSEEGRNTSHRLESQFLDTGLDTSDISKFGMAGEDLGFASWEGLSYYSQLKNSRAIDNLIEFQIATHSLWWLSKCLSEVWLSNPAKAAAQLKSYIPELKRQYLIIKNIEAKETVSQRTMIESVIKMNRLDEITHETLELYR